MGIGSIKMSIIILATFIIANLLLRPLKQLKDNIDKRH